MKSRLLPDSAPVSSEKDGRGIGKRCPGFNLEAIHKMAICADVSKPEMDFRRSSCSAGGYQGIESLVGHTVPKTNAWWIHPL